MADLLSGAAPIGLGAMKYLSDVQSNKNARAQNATTDKWGPMLALYTHGGGAPQMKVPKASFAEVMGPAMVSAANAMSKKPGGGGGENPMMMAGDQGEQSNQLMDFLGGGGMMMAAHGGKVPGKAKVPGDSPMNDTQLTMTSPGEVVLPRTVAKEGMHGNHWKVAQYLNDVKKHGPGPLPLKNPPGPGKAKSSSMSPWEAMACGGMTR